MGRSFAPEVLAHALMDLAPMSADSRALLDAAGVLFEMATTEKAPPRVG